MRFPFPQLSILLLLCAGCESFSFRPETADDEEKAERVPLVLGLRSELRANPALATLPVSLPAPETPGEWRQTGRLPEKVAGHIKALRQGQLVWSVQTGQGGSRKQALTSPPVLAQGRLFLLDAGQTVHAISPESGESLWSHTLSGLKPEDKVAVGGGLGHGDEVLIVTSGFGYVAALDPASGSRLWTLETGVPMTGAASIFKNRAYAVSSNNDLFAIDTDKGEIVWVDQTISEPARILSSSSPAITETLLVAPFSSGELIAYLPANGRRLWIETLTLSGRFSPISAINDIASRPVIYDGMVYAASQSGLLAAIDARTGKQVWSLEFPAIRPPAIVGDFLFAVSTNAELVCMKRDDGEILWVRQLRRFQEKKKKRLVWSTPLLVSGQVILASSDGELLSLSAQDGSQQGSLSLGHPVLLDPVSADGRLYVLADDGVLAAIE